MHRWNIADVLEIVNGPDYISPEFLHSAKLAASLRPWVTLQFPRVQHSLQDEKIMAEIPEQIYVLCNSNSLLWASPAAGSLAITAAAPSWAARPLGLLHHVLCLWQLPIPISARCAQTLWDNTWVVEEQPGLPHLAPGLSHHLKQPHSCCTRTALNPKGHYRPIRLLYKYYQNNSPCPLFHLLCWLQWMKNSRISAKNLILNNYITSSLVGGGLRASEFWGTIVIISYVLSFSCTSCSLWGIYRCVAFHAACTQCGNWYMLKKNNAIFCIMQRTDSKLEIETGKLLVQSNEKKFSWQELQQFLKISSAKILWK